MKAIVIAAGPCTRLRPLTDDTPKCMLKVNGKSILGHIIEIYRDNGVKDISVIRGYRKEKINFNDVTYFDNVDFWNNNILHSLMCARPKIEEAQKLGEDVIVSYSDILYEDSVVKDLLESEKDISAIVDIDWWDYYDGRTDHPIEEAENVILDKNKKMLKIGKHIFTHGIHKDSQGEFIGLWKFTPTGIAVFLRHFDRLNAKLEMTEPFQNAKEWQKAYMTDIFQEMIDMGEIIYCVPIQKKWQEFDTVQDFQKANNYF